MFAHSSFVSHLDFSGFYMRMLQAWICYGLVYADFPFDWASMNPRPYTVLKTLNLWLNRASGFLIESLI